MSSSKTTTNSGSNSIFSSWKRQQEEQQQQQQQHQEEQKASINHHHYENKNHLGGEIKRTTPERFIRRHDSEFSVSSMKYHDPSSNDLNVWQGAALLMADCLGTGILALPHDVHTLGMSFGLFFLIINLPINFYAGTILSMAAQHVEEQQKGEEWMYQQKEREKVEQRRQQHVQSVLGGKQQQQQQQQQIQQQQEEEESKKKQQQRQKAQAAKVRASHRNEEEETHLPTAIVTTYNSIVDVPLADEDLMTEDIDPNNKNKKLSLSSDDDDHNHRHLHHDTATFDFIGMTQALFYNGTATRLVMLLFYTNIFLVLGNYILVMSHAVRALVGEELCLPQAGIMASTLMFAVCQMRTMAKLGRSASIISLTALAIVIVQCLIASYNNSQQQNLQLQQPIMQNITSYFNATTTTINHQDDSSRSLQQHQDENEQNTLSSSTTSTSSTTTEAYMIFRQFSALGSIGFAVGSQKLFLNIRREFQDRTLAPKSLGIALTAFGIFYVVVVLVCGNNPPSFLFDAIPSNTYNRRFAGLFLWIHVVVSYAINSQAICSSMDRLLFGSGRLSSSSSSSSSTSSSTMMIMSPSLTRGGPLLNGDDEEDRAGIVTTTTTNNTTTATPTTTTTTATTTQENRRWMMITACMAVCAFFVSNAIPFFKDLVALIGALTSVPLTLLLPAIFYRKYNNVPVLWLWTNHQRRRHQLRRRSSSSTTTRSSTARNTTPSTSILSVSNDVMSFALVVFSVVFMITALIGVAWSIATDWSEHGPPFSCN